MDDGTRDSIRERLIWAVRFIAAEPDAAIALIEREHLHIDELALVLDDVLPVARLEGVVPPDALAILDEIDSVFDAMSGEAHTEQWTDVAVRSGAEWGAQRERAREVLRLLGASRADEELAGHV